MMKLTMPNGVTLESSDPQEIARILQSKDGGLSVAVEKGRSGGSACPPYRCPDEETPENPVRVFWRGSGNPILAIDVFDRGEHKWACFVTGENRYEDNVLEASPQLRTVIDRFIAKGEARELAPGEEVALTDQQVADYERLIMMFHDPRDLKRFTKVPNSKVAASARKKLALLAEAEAAHGEIASGYHGTRDVPTYKV